MFLFGILLVFPNFFLGDCTIDVIDTVAKGIGSYFSWEVYRFIFRRYKYPVMYEPGASTFSNAISVLSTRDLFGSELEMTDVDRANYPDFASIPMFVGALAISVNLPFLQAIGFHTSLI
jgi:hypothetical protein